MRSPKPGKLEIRATKPMANQRDLSRAYSPGVAEACLEIKADPANAALYSQFGNLDTDSGRRMRGALAILDAQDLDFAYEGEMHSDAALDPELRARIFPNARFDGRRTC